MNAQLGHHDPDLVMRYQQLDDVRWLLRAFHNIYYSRPARRASGELQHSEHFYFNILRDFKIFDIYQSRVCTITPPNPLLPLPDFGIYRPYQAVLSDLHRSALPQHGHLVWYAGLTLQKSVEIQINDAHQHPCSNEGT